MARDEIDESALIKAAQAGDTAALEQLLIRHQNQIYAFGRRMCGDPEDAKDVLQETLLAASRSLPDFRGTARLSTWLFTIARRFCLRKREREGAADARSVPLESAARTVADERSSPETAYQSRELATVIEGAISALDPKQREVFILRDVEGFSAPEVAEVLGVRIEAVKSRLHRARGAIRARLAPLLDAEVGPSLPGCPDIVESFSRHLEGDISPALCEEMERHLAGCTPCKTTCESLKKALASCRTTAPPEIPPELASSIKEAIRALVVQRA